MKKAQVLSAIALAFALGVVAPVAGVNAFTPEVKNANGVVTTAGKVTKAEADNAVNAVSALYPEYSKIEAVYELANDTTVTDLSRTTVTNLEAKLQAVGVVTTGVINNTDKRVDIVEALIDLANGVEHYGAISTWFTTINDTKSTDQDVRNAIAAINSSYGTHINNSLNVTKQNYSYYRVPGESSSILSQIMATFESDAASGVYYSAFGDLVSATNTAKDKKEAYVAYKNAIINAVKTAGLTDAGALAVRDAENGATQTNEGLYTNITTLKALAGNANISNYTKWTNVIDKVQALEDGAVEGADTHNYGLVKAVAEAIKAIPAVDTNVSIEDIVAQLVGYTAPSTPSDKPTEGDKDEEKDPAAPGTGIVSTAEGNAATTVSIVAGLATALTALGAGVVAYRNARRN